MFACSCNYCSYGVSWPPHQWFWVDLLIFLELLQILQHVICPAILKRRVIAGAVTGHFPRRNPEYG